MVACPVCGKRLHDPKISTPTPCNMCGAIAYCREEHLRLDRARHHKRCGTESCVAEYVVDHGKNEWTPVNKVEEGFSNFVYEKNLCLGIALVRVKPNPQFARYARMQDFAMVGIYEGK